MSNKETNINKIAFASSFGTLFEWYDFLIYGTAAALVFNTLFFPSVDPAVGILGSVLSFAIGFIARPLGGIVFGHIGDRYGRKTTLMSTMLLMGIATILIGLLPTYNDIGIWAPVLLVTLRVLQGIAFGGEWSGASLIILEHAPKDKRSFYGSFIQLGWPMGLLLATGMYAIVTQLPEEQFLEWGWRIPFLASIVLVVVGVFIRAKLSETPVFEELQKNKKIARVPFLQLLKQEPKTILTGIGLSITQVSWAYLLTVFFVIYAVNNLGIARSEVMESILIASAVNLIAIPFFGWVADRVGRRVIYRAGAVATLIIAFPVFWMLANGMITAAMIIGLVIGTALMMAPQPSYLPELFKSNVRYTGSSLVFQLASTIGGGVIPVAATWIASTTGSLTGVGILIFALGFIGFIASTYAKETKGAIL